MLRFAAALVLLPVFVPGSTVAQAGAARFSSTGGIHGTTATGGWSTTPDKCRNDTTPADPNKLFTLIFVNSPSPQGKRLDWPNSFAVAKKERGYSAHIQNDDGTSEDLSASNCKVFKVEMTANPSGGGGAHTSVNGSLQLDCTARDVHVTSDLHFTNCQ